MLGFISTWGEAARHLSDLLADFWHERRVRPPKSKNKGGGTRTLLENQLFHHEPLGACWCNLYYVKATTVAY